MKSKIFAYPFLYAMIAQSSFLYAMTPSPTPATPSATSMTPSAAVAASTMPSTPPVTMPAPSTTSSMGTTTPAASTMPSSTTTPPAATGMGTMPTTPASTTSSMGGSMSSTAPSMGSSSMGSSTPAQAASSMTTPAAASSAPSSSFQDKHVKEFDEINTALARIKVIEKEIRSSANAFDEKLLRARAIELETKELSFNILKEEQETKARELFEKMKTLLAELKDIQQFGQTESTKVTQEKTGEITTLIAKVNGILPPLQAAAITEKASEKKEEKVEEKKASSHDEMNAELANKETSSPRKSKAQDAALMRAPLSTRIWNMITDSTVSVIKSINRVIDWAIGLLKSSEKKKSKQFSDATGMSLSELLNKSKEIQITSAQSLQSLEDAYISLVRTIQEKRREVRRIVGTIKEIPMLAVYIEEHQDDVQTVPPQWKKESVKMFSKVIDLGVAIADALVSVVRTVYAYTLAPIFNTFYSDVKKKLQEQ